jgi:hypothetical protein
MSAVSETFKTIEMREMQNPLLGRVAGIAGLMGVVVGWVTPWLLFQNEVVAAANGEWLRLEVTAPRSVTAGKPFVVVAHLRNIGSTPITLPGAGDGTVSGGDTTPLVTVHAEVFENGIWRERTQIASFGGCGNRDEPDETRIRSMKTGESLPLEAEIGVRRPGEYRFRVTYENDPSFRRRDWSEDSTGVRLLRESTGCAVTSQSFLVTVHDSHIIRVHVHSGMWDGSEEDRDAWEDAGRAQICF